MTGKKLRKKHIFGAALVVCLLFVYDCVSYAAKNSGAYWSGFTSQDGLEQDLSSGFVVVDAMDARNSNLDTTGMGPYRGAGPSFDDPGVALEELEVDEPEGGEIPEIPTVWNEVEVAAGDTLSLIADKHKITVKEIMQANELTNQHRLRAGQILFVPTSPDHVLETLAHVRQMKHEALAKRKQAEPIEITQYVVKTGDTLWKVANAFDLDVNTLFGSNKLTGDSVLKIGSTVRVPNQDGIFVKVAAGQTLDKLAKQYGIFPEAILSANRMRGDEALAQGREVFLPGAKISTPAEQAPVTTARKTSPAENVKEKVVAKRGFGWPVVGKISSPFGWRRDPVRGGRDFHTGLDIRAPRGRPIVAAAAGKVVHSGWMGGYGKTIVISHPNNMTTLYAHCSSLLVKSGTTIKRGQRIALVGSTGRSTGNHLHFEVRQGGRPMNPLKFIR